MKILADNPQGCLWQNDGNETIQDSKYPDAAKFRVGAPYEAGESGGGGAFSFDVIAGIPGQPADKRVEVAVLTGGMQGNGGGEVGLSITKPGTYHDITDAAQQKVVEFRGDGVEFKVPISAPNLPVANQPILSTELLRSTNGRFLLAMQNDGNLVVYDLKVGVPLWASNTVTA